MAGLKRVRAQINRDNLRRKLLTKLGEGWRLVPRGKFSGHCYPDDGIAKGFSAPAWLMNELVLGGRIEWDKDSHILGSYVLCKQTVRRTEAVSETK